MSEKANAEKTKMQEIDRRAAQDKRRWLIIMLLIIAAVLALTVTVSILSMQLLPYAFIFAIIAVAITVKLCVAQMGKVLEKQKSERQRLDDDGRFSRFDL